MCESKGPTKTLDMIFKSFNKDEFTTVYVDGANLYFGCRSIDFKFDFNEFKLILEKYTRIKCMNYFVSLPPDDVDGDEFIQGRKLVKFLKNNGWRVYNTVATVARNDDGSYRIVKGNVDVDLASRAVNDVHCSGGNNSKHIVFVTGDKDYVGTLDILRQYARVTVIASRNTLSEELKEIADEVIDLEDLRLYVDRRTWLSKREILHSNDEVENDEVIPAKPSAHLLEEVNA